MKSENRTWLIKRTDNSFSRPMPESELLRRIQNGELKSNDEICCAKDYWFSLHDVKEIRKHFGELSLDGLFKKVVDDVTQENEPITATTIQIPNFQASGHQPMGAPTQPRPAIKDQPSLTTKILITILLMVVAALIFLLYY